MAGLARVTPQKFFWDKLAPERVDYEINNHFYLSRGIQSYHYNFIYYLLADYSIWYKMNKSWQYVMEQQ
jgi:hypothetical protein